MRKAPPCDGAWVVGIAAIAFPIVERTSAVPYDQRMPTCPACQHTNESVALTRGSWIWPFNKPILMRCSHTTVEQDALVDLHEVCNCGDHWHTAASNATTPSDALRDHAHS